MSEWDDSESESELARGCSRLLLSCDLSDDTIGFKALTYLHQRCHY